MIIRSSCSATGDCSAQMQAALTACHAVHACAIQFAPPRATFHLEQTVAVTASRVDGLTLNGNGATFVLDGHAPFIYAANCTNVTLANFTLTAARPSFTYGVVRSSTERQRVNLSVDMNVFGFGPSAGGASDWRRSVDCLHQVDPHPPFAPTVNGIDWIYRATSTAGPALAVDVDRGTSTVAFADRSFELRVGDGVVLRHSLEFSHPHFDAIVVDRCAGVAVRNVEIQSSVGMALLAHDCTDVDLVGVVTRPSKAAPQLAANADFIHIASCRGTVRIRGCRGIQQGDDGVNVHSQYALIQSLSPGAVAGSTSTDVIVAPHANADNSSWGTLFSSPVFRVGASKKPRRARSFCSFSSSDALSSFRSRLLPPRGPRPAASQPAGVHHRARDANTRRAAGPAADADARRRRESARAGGRR